MLTEMVKIEEITELNFSGRNKKKETNYFMSYIKKFNPIYKFFEI
jgi:hypothetical protein